MPGAMGIAGSSPLARAVLHVVASPSWLLLAIIHLS